VDADLFAKLAAPFEDADVRWKPQAVSGARALAIPYLDARAVQDRLDRVLGPGNWSDDYQVLTDGSVMCRLRVRVDGEWITKTDVGSQSEQPDEGDRMKSAFSDALKRAAVKYGIGRFLYRLPPQWVAWDGQKKRFTERPRLPALRPAVAPSQPPRRPAPEPARPHAGDRIAPYEAKVLYDLIQQTGTDPAAFCQHYGGIEDVSHLAPEKLEEAVTFLRRKLGKKPTPTPAA
jgi:hypothetical protein